MHKKQNVVILFMVCLILSACGAQQTPNPTAVRSSTPSSSPTVPATPTLAATSTPMAVETATVTPTATPPLVCNPGETIENTANSSLPGYIDILNVSTKLKGSNLIVTFKMSWLPDEIMIDRDILGNGATEIAWGVAADVDNDPATGSPIALINSGYGYEYSLQAVNFKEGDEHQGDIPTLFSDKTNVWEYFPNGSTAIDNSGKLKVDKDAATLTLSGDIKGITRKSYLHFFAVYFPAEAQQLTDELCQR